MYGFIISDSHKANKGQTVNIRIIFLSLPGETADIGYIVNNLGKKFKNNSKTTH